MWRNCSGRGCAMIRLFPKNNWADYWKSQGRKFCDFCKCWIADNKPSIEFHEGGKKHKENVGKRLKEIHKNSTKQAKQSRKFEDDIKKMENAAMAAYLKDVEGNNVDLTAAQIMRDKLNRKEKNEPEENPNRMPPATPETNPRFNPNGKIRDQVDPCDTYAHMKRNSQQKGVPQGPTTSGDNRGKTKPCRDKKKGKKSQEEDLPNQPKVQKLWYEARCPEGTYYWHIETNESVWDPPEEGFLTVEEQEEEAKEQAIQAEFLEQIEKEQAREKAELIEEQRANAEREKLRELRKRRGERRKKNDDGELSGVEERQPRRELETNREKSEDEDDDEKIPYRRDYSVPEKPDPYGPWQTVKIIPQKIVDLQLPKKKTSVDVPTLQNSDPPSSARIFVEKTVTQLSTGDSDDDAIPTTFKKRKFGVKNVRKRFDDD